FVQMDESEDQTRAINRRQAQEAEQKVLPCPPDLFSRWHELFRSFGLTKVRIPFASQLAECLPGRVRSRRDLPKLLGLIEASAYLHQHQRSRDEHGFIVANPHDYQIARELFEHCYYVGPECAVGELLKAAGNLGKADFPVTDLIQATGWGKSKAYAVLNRAEELGNIVEAEERGRYRLVHDRVEPLLNLPLKVRLSAEDFRISTGTPQAHGIFRNS